MTGILEINSVQPKEFCFYRPPSFDMIVKANNILTTADNFEKSFPGNFFLVKFSRKKVSRILVWKFRFSAFISRNCVIEKNILRIEISRIIKFNNWEFSNTKVWELRKISQKTKFDDWDFSNK